MLSCGYLCFPCWFWKKHNSQPMNNEVALILTSKFLVFSNKSCIGTRYEEGKESNKLLGKRSMSQHINNKIENGNGECVKENNPTIEKTTAECHQQVFNVARNSRTRTGGGVPQLTPKHIYISSVIMNTILISKLYTRN